jgi:hypothetical protein
LREVDASFATFSANWPQQAAAAKTALDAHAGRFQSSYRRLVSLQAWREQLLDGKLSPPSLQFFLEAQNDALLSHVSARYGMWRAALQSLRSCVENVLACLYYMDHPVELALWERGKHRPGFAELHAYFVAHPALDGIASQDTGLPALKDEYAMLSKAVHGSAASFRMTQGAAGPTLWIAEPPRLGMWATRETATIRSLNMLLLALFRADLSGTQRVGLRQAVSLAVPRSQYARIHSRLGVRLSAQT